MDVSFIKYGGSNVSNMIYDTRNLELIIKKTDLIVTKKVTLKKLFARVEFYKYCLTLRGKWNIEETDEGGYLYKGNKESDYIYFFYSKKVDNFSALEGAKKRLSERGDYEHEGEWRDVGEYYINGRRCNRYELLKQDNDQLNLFQIRLEEDWYIYFLSKTKKGKAPCQEIIDIIDTFVEQDEIEAYHLTFEELNSEYVAKLVGAEHLNAKRNWWILVQMSVFLVPILSAGWWILYDEKRVRFFYPDQMAYSICFSWIDIFNIFVAIFVSGFTLGAFTEICLSRFFYKKVLAESTEKNSPKLYYDFKGTSYLILSFIFAFIFVILSSSIIVCGQDGVKNYFAGQEISAFEMQYKNVKKIEIEISNNDNYEYSFLMELSDGKRHYRVEKNMWFPNLDDSADPKYSKQTLEMASNLNKIKTLAQVKSLYKDNKVSIKYFGFKTEALELMLAKAKRMSPLIEDQLNEFMEIKN